MYGIAGTAANSMSAGDAHIINPVNAEVEKCSSIIEPGQSAVQILTNYLVVQITVEVVQHMLQNK
jgi:hypothetical protein